MYSFSLYANIYPLVFKEPNIPDQSPIDYNIWLPNQEDLESEFASYNLPDDTIPYNQKQMLFNEVEQKMPSCNRDPRSKEKPTKEPPKLVKSKKKNLSDKIFSYHNVRLAKNRLLHDEEDLPIDILKDTYFKNEDFLKTIFGDSLFKKKKHCYDVLVSDSPFT